MPIRPLISTVDLGYTFIDSGESVPALRGVSMEIMPGKVTSVVGPSGCGKSTLLYLLGLLDKPTIGTINLDGQSMHDASDQIRTEIRNRHIGFVFQFHFLIKELTVLENVTLPALKGGMSSDSADANAKKILDELDLSEKIHRPAFKLSGGEQQRVAIARALSNSPKVILADEPTGNLDSRNSEHVFSILKQFAHNQKIAVIMVTHNQELARKSDQVVEMMDGRIIS